MKLSDAIRLGAMLKPQGFNDFVDEAGSTCALGAAYEAIGADAYEGDLFNRWPVVLEEAPCPVCNASFSFLDPTVETVIPHLNDDHRWTREQIADWVATVEAAQATDQPASVAALDPVDEVVAVVPRA